MVFSSMTFLPLFFFTQISDIMLLVIVAVNMLFHAWVDDLKANQFKINLIQDQLFHFAQIIVTYIVYRYFA